MSGKPAPPIPWLDVYRGSLLTVGALNRKTPMVTDALGVEIIQRTAGQIVS